MKSATKDETVALLENRLREYRLKVKSLEHDIIAAKATGAEDSDSTVEKLEEQIEHLKLAHAAIEAELRRVKSKPQKTEKAAIPQGKRKKK